MTKAESQPQSGQDQRASKGSLVVSLDGSTFPRNQAGHWDSITATVFAGRSEPHAFTSDEIAQMPSPEDTSPLDPKLSRFFSVLRPFGIATATAAAIAACQPAGPIGPIVVVESPTPVPDGGPVIAVVTSPTPEPSKSASPTPTVKPTQSAEASASPIVTASPTESPVVTASPTEAPTPTPTETHAIKSVNDIIDADHGNVMLEINGKKVKVTIDNVKKAISVAISKDPKALPPYYTPSKVNLLFQQCQTGKSDSNGVTGNPEQVKETACLFILRAFRTGYETTGLEEFNVADQGIYEITISDKGLGMAAKPLVDKYLRG